jgi:hypothetical protein
MKSIILNLGGQDRTFYFGLGFLGNFLEKTGVQMTDIDAKIKENPFKWIPEIMYHSLAFGYIRKNEFPVFDAYDVAEWIDEETETVEVEIPFFNKHTGLFETKKELSKKIISDFFVALRQSQTKDVPEQKEVKKKVTKR